MTTLAGTSVLIVDDDADNREVLTLALQRLGAKVASATTAGEARTLLAGEPFQVLLCDLSLRDTESGFALMTSIAKERARGLYAVAITGWSDHDAKKRALAAGFDDFYLKPVKIEQLVARLAARP